jgi:hypothetical protein
MNALLWVCAFGITNASHAAEPITLEIVEQSEPLPPIVAALTNAPPSDSIVLFNGNDTREFESSNGKNAPWQVVDGTLIIEPGTGDIRTKRRFGDIQLHLEYRVPIPHSGQHGQDRGNSGVFFMGLYELQILDSYGNETYVNGQAASIYKQYPPQVNASRPPGEWQTYDVVFRAPRFESKNVAPARMTVFHNGVLVHDNAEIRGPTASPGKPSYTAHEAQLPLLLQDHGHRVAFRNIWARPLDVAAHPR